MNPTVESAWIAAAATFVGVGGAVTVAIAAARYTRRTNQATLDAAHADAQLTLDAAREAQFADRYSRALDQVGSANLDVRIGGIFALEGIALDSPRHHPTVMEVLTAFVRGHSPAPVDSPKLTRRALPDVEAALAVVGRRKVEHDIRAMDLTHAVLAGADLTRTRLARAVLFFADLSGAVLTDAVLVAAELTGADLSRANLTGADLTRADLSNANLIRADLSRANLDNARLDNARLDNARLGAARLTNANLSGVVLADAYLAGADLAGADLAGADFSDAFLIGADFSGTDPAYALFARADLTGAVWPEDRAVPNEWKLDGRGRLMRAPGPGES